MREQTGLLHREPGECKPPERGALTSGTREGGEERLPPEPRPAPDAVQAENFGGIAAPAARAERPMLAAGAQLGPYTIVAFLGAGGMGEVYHAFDPRLDRHIALKVLSTKAVAAGFGGRFVREAVATASLNHPNIAHIYEIGEAGVTCYIAMEYVNGVTLRRRMNSPDCTLREVLGYLQQAADALDHAHAHGVVHCDLKPDNIMVTPEGAVKVLDFGLAKLIRRYRLESSAAAAEVHAATVTLIPESSATLVAGTIGYMSPEQAEGRVGIDERSDIFSFGCLLFEAATRRLPFSGESNLHALHNLLYERPPRVSSLCVSPPGGLQRLIDSCLQKDPEQRCRSMAEVSRSLSDLLQDPRAERTTLLIAQPLRRFLSRLRETGAGTGTALSKKVVALSLVALLAITLGALVFLRVRLSAPAASIAVIPFTDLRSTPDTEYLSDGISEGIINALARVPGLRVIARTSSFRFKGKEIDVRSAARTLAVQLLVTGRVAEIGGRLRIAVELVNGADGTQIWGARYNTAAAGLSELEAQISHDIAGRIGSKLTQTEWDRLQKETKLLPDAYELLLRGRYQMQLYTPESRRKAVSYYQQAVALDPASALAHAELARSYRLLGGSAVVDGADALPKAEAAAQRALAIDKDLAEAHAALADIRKDQWNWKSAELEYRRAIQLNPNLPYVHQGFAIYQSVMGRYEAAAREIQRAIELDPLGLPTAIHAAAVYSNTRRYRDALTELRRAAELDPAAPSLWAWTGIIYGATRQFPAAIAAYEKSMVLGDDTAATQCYYGYALARAGRRDQSLQILARLQAADKYLPRTMLAILFTGLDQRERALQLLLEAYKSRDPLLQYLKVDAHYDVLRSDPRFHELAARIGLPH